MAQGATVFVVCICYFVLGFGVTTLVSQAKDRNKALLEMLFWPMVLAVYSLIGDID